MDEGPEECAASPRAHHPAMHPLSLSGNSASAARRPEEEVGSGCFGQENCPLLGGGGNGSTPRARAAQAWRGEQHAARNPGTRRPPRPFPHPPPPPALRNKARLRERGAPRPSTGSKDVSPLPASDSWRPRTQPSQDRRWPRPSSETPGKHTAARVEAAEKWLRRRRQGGGVGARTHAHKASLGRRAPGGRGGAAATLSPRRMRSPGSSAALGLLRSRGNSSLVPCF